MGCHSVVSRMAVSTSVLLVGRVWTLAKEAKLIVVAALLIALAMLCCTHSMDRYVSAYIFGMTVSPVGVTSTQNIIIIYGLRIATIVIVHCCEVLYVRNCCEVATDS